MLPVDLDADKAFRDLLRELPRDACFLARSTDRCESRNEAETGSDDAAASGAVALDY